MKAPPRDVRSAEAHRPVPPDSKLGQLGQLGQLAAPAVLGLLWSAARRPHPPQYQLHHSPLTTHHSPITTHHSPLNTHHSPITTQHSTLTNHHSTLSAASLTRHLLPAAAATTSVAGRCAGTIPSRRACPAWMPRTRSPAAPLASSASAALHSSGPASPATQCCRWMCARAHRPGLWASRVAAQSCVVRMQCAGPAARPACTAAGVATRCGSAPQ